MSTYGHNKKVNSLSYFKANVSNKLYQAVLSLVDGAQKVAVVGSLLFGRQPYDIDVIVYCPRHPFGFKTPKGIAGASKTELDYLIALNKKVQRLVGIDNFIDLKIYTSIKPFKPENRITDMGFVAPILYIPSNELLGDQPDFMPFVSLVPTAKGFNVVDKNNRNTSFRHQYNEQKKTGNQQK